MNILQEIFSDHFHKLNNSGIKIRNTVIENVDKMIHCGDFKRGYALYACDNCGHMMVTPFRCRSRFCNSCGNLYSRKRSTPMSFKLVRTSHRHCVFTIHEELRVFFRKDRSLLNILFKAAADSVFFMFKKLNKSEKYFKMIRYYGIYAKHHRHEGRLSLFISKEKRRFHTRQNVWRPSISLSFHFNPLLCKCGHEMTLLQFYLKGTPFFENYKNLVNSS